MRCFCAFESRVSGSIRGFLVGLLGGLTARIDIVVSTVCGAVNEYRAIKLRDEGQDVKCWECVNGVVCGGHIAWESVARNWNLLLIKVELR